MRQYNAFRWFACVLAISLVYGQAVTGTITGFVKDPNGASVPGATVVARNVGTNEETRTTTNDEGFYRFANLVPGEYSIEIEAKGFRKWIASAQRLSVGDALRVDASLELGAVTETVTVETTATQVNTEDAQLGYALQNPAGLPILSGAAGRNTLNLLGIQPGVNFEGQVAGYSVNGQRGQANNYMLDGGDSNDLAINVPDAVEQISPNALSEFRIVTGAMKAEYGRATGGVIQLFTRSGENAFHGTLSETFRNTKLNAVPFFQKSVSGGTPERFASGLPRKPQWNSNDFDAALGGPIRKDKTFFFASYLGFRRRQGVSRSATVFNDQERAAIEQFGVPEAKALLALVPRASTGNTLFSSPSNSLTRDQGLIKIDHNLTSANRLSGTYFIEERSFADPFAFGGGSVPGFGTVGTLRFQNVVLRDTHTFSPSVLNEFRASFHRRGTLSVIPQNTTKLGSLGLTGIIPDDASAEGPPNVRITGFDQFGNTIQGPQGRADNTFQYIDNLSWNHGKHYLKLGGEFRTYAQNQIFDFINNGLIFVDGTGTNENIVTRRIPGLSAVLNDFANGFATEFDQSNANRQGYRTRSVNWFVQDDWKVRPNLALNLGLRYEFNTNLTEIRDRVATFRRGQQSKVFPTAPVGVVYPGDDGITRSTYSSDKNNFAPRFGFAWDVFKNGKLSVRGGWGLFYDIPITELTLQFLGVPPYGIGPAVLSVDYKNPYPTSRENPIPQPFPFIPVQRGGRFDYTSIAPVSLTIMDPGFRTPYGQQWNLQVQTELAQGWLLSAGYIGSTGVKLLNRRELNWAVPGPGATSGNTDRRRILNQGNPQNAQYGGAVFGGITNQLTDSNSNYNSLQIGLNKRFGKNLQMTHAYTWAHAIDDASGLRVNSLIDNARFDRGNSEQDIRHRYVASYRYELPFFRDRKGVGRVLGGWGISGVTTFQTGRVINITEPQDRCLCGAGNNRPDYIGGNLTFFDPRNTNKVAGKPNSYFDGTGGGTGGAATNPFFRRVGTGASFALGAGRYGNFGRNVFHGPGINNWDLALFKIFRFTERHNAELRTEWFNTFNHTQFLNPTTSIGSVNFGRVTDAREPRIIQFALIYRF